MGRSKIPRHDLLTELRSVAEQVDGRLQTSDMDTLGSYSAKTYINRFGSWQAALEAAGIDADPTPRTPQITDEELIAELRRLNDDLEDYPKTTDMNERGAYSCQPYFDRFGSWQGALDAAGIEADARRSPPIPTEDLEAELHRLADELGGTPSVADMEAHGEYAADTYAQRYGSWNAAVEAAGLPPNERMNNSEERLLEAIRELRDDLGRVPSTTDMHKHGPFSYQVYLQRFESWDAALERAEIDE